LENKNKVISIPAKAGIQTLNGNKRARVFYLVEDNNGGVSKNKKNLKARQA
jgi:hypothetical protein